MQNSKFHFRTTRLLYMGGNEIEVALYVEVSRTVNDNNDIEYSVESVGVLSFSQGEHGLYWYNNIYHKWYLQIAGSKEADAFRRELEQEASDYDYQNKLK